MAPPPQATKNVQLGQQKTQNLPPPLISQTSSRRLTSVRLMVTCKWTERPSSLSSKSRQATRTTSWYVLLCWLEFQPTLCSLSSSHVIARFIMKNHERLSRSCPSRYLAERTSHFLPPSHFTLILCCSEVKDREERERRRERSASSSSGVLLTPLPLARRARLG